MKATNNEWLKKLEEVEFDYNFISSPRGKKVKEVISGKYVVPMPAFISLKSRKVNKGFMFAEAYWILSGSNLLSEIQPYMEIYGSFSDDQNFLRGAYGPKVVDQLGYVVDTLIEDNDSRQAIINIWRERPGKSKDIPCTLSIQALIRNNTLNLVITMRSNDIVLGFTYDVFTFSMIGKAIQLLLRERGVKVSLGNLYVNAGSLHMYENHWGNLQKWENDKEDLEQDLIISVEGLENVPSFIDLIYTLKHLAKKYKVNK